MQQFNPELLRNLYIPPKDSHKGQNGKVLVIAGSELFHAASLWTLSIASKIVDMVFYASVPTNNHIVEQAKSEFRNGIVIPRDRIDDYIQEADSIVIGPGLPRLDGQRKGDDDTKILSENLLKKYTDKRWVIDGGSLQTIQPEVLNGLKQTPILTPHQGEFEQLKSKVESLKLKNAENLDDQAEIFAKEYNCIVILKGAEDIICSPFGGTQGKPQECIKVTGGNAGMTKGGTGDVLAGLVAALYAKNDAFLAATAASYINKKAGENLFEKVGYYFNASDLIEEIPRVMKTLLV